MYSWLSLLSAKCGSLSAREDIAEFTSLCPLPIGVIDLKLRSLIAASACFMMTLGIDEKCSAWMGPDELADKPATAELLLGLLANGTVDAYEVRRTLRRCDGSEFDARNWVSTCPLQRRNDLALWLVAPVGYIPNALLAEPPPERWSLEHGGVVLGRFNAEWKIEKISAGVEVLLGYTAGEVVGLSLLQAIHPEDAAQLLSIAARSLSERMGVGAELRIRHKNGTWCHARVIVTPLHGTKLLFGFVFTANEHPEILASRASELERRLWNIAQEVEASGVAYGFRRAAEPKVLPSLKDLSARQWEILNRLMRGERVPGIADALFISPNTVRNHLSAIYQKLGVNSQAELLALVRGDNSSVSEVQE